MSKKSLRGDVMSDISVDQATQWARELTQRECRGPGDLPNAWRRLEARYGVPAQTFWSLRYRRPKDLLASIYLQLRAAYQAECERQMRRLEHELAITKALAGPDHAVVVKVQAVVRAPDPAPPVTDDDLEIPEFLRRT